MDMHPITDSSMFSAHGYEHGEINLTFKQGGHTYAYPISPEQYEDFKLHCSDPAKSAGGWYHANIKGKKIEGRKVQVAQAV